MKKKIKEKLIFRDNQNVIAVYKNDVLKNPYIVIVEKDIKLSPLSFEQERTRGLEEDIGYYSEYECKTFKEVYTKVIEEINKKFKTLDFHIKDVMKLAVMLKEEE